MIMQKKIAEGIFTKEQIDYVNGVKDEDLRSALLHQVRLRDNMESDRNAFEKKVGPISAKDTYQPEKHVRHGFEKELENLINRYSKEAESNTPDYVLAEFLKNSMDNFHRATKLRDNWYGGRRSIINDQDKMWEVEAVKTEAQ